jgi:hypothetical protein
MQRLALVLAISTLFVAPFSEARTLTLLEHAYEVSLSHLTLPNSEVGTLIFRACESCDAVAIRVDTDTRYLTDEGPMALSDFRAYVAGLGTPETQGNTIVGVFRAVDDGRVTRVVVHVDD